MRIESSIESDIITTELFNLYMFFTHTEKIICMTKLIHWCHVVSEKRGLKLELTVPFVISF